MQRSSRKSQTGESDVNQDTVLSRFVYCVSATFPVPAINPTYCTNDYDILQNINREHKQPGDMH